MAVDAAMLAEIRALDATVLPDDELSPLVTIPEVLAYTIAQAREQGEDEVDMVELVIRSANMTPGAVRGAERVLAQLGYTSVAERLRKIAGRRKNGLAPFCG